MNYERIVLRPALCRVDFCRGTGIEGVSSQPVNRFRGKGHKTAIAYYLRSSAPTAYVHDAGRPCT